MTEIVWWESCITEHQIHTLAELSYLPNTKVTVFSERLENLTRKKQGWKECDWSLIDMNLIPSFGVRFIIKTLRRQKDCVHIFGGPFDSWMISLALFLSVYLGNRTYILTEPYSPFSSGLLEDGGHLRNWLLHKIRPLKYRFLWVFLRSKIDGVFTISTTAIEQLLSFGVSKEKIFPYAYFVPSANLVKKVLEKEDARGSSYNSLSLIFVGSLNHIKGIDLLVNSVNDLRDEGLQITLDVFGPAESENDYSWSCGVKYQGIIPFGEVQATMAVYDFLILPSRYDGWGVVVNEALMAGIPVICSDKAGSSSLVQKWGCGVCYEGAVDLALKKCIFDIYHNKKATLGGYKDSVNKVCRVITPKYGAEYIYDCIKVMRVKGLDEKNSWYD